MRLSELICLKCEGKYFCKRGWTGHFGKHEVICPSGQISPPSLFELRGTRPACPPQLEERKAAAVSGRFRIRDGAESVLLFLRGMTTMECPLTGAKADSIQGQANVS